MSELETQAEPKKYLTVEEIAEAQDLPITDEFVPEWNGWVRWRAMTALEREKLEKEMIDYKGRMKPLPYGWRQHVLAYCLVDEKGKPLFTPPKLAALAEKNSAVLKRLYDLVEEPSGIGATENASPELDEAKN